MTDQRTNIQDQEPAEEPTRPRHERQGREDPPRGNPPVDQDAVERGREVLDRVKPH
jgi:hypothetical protein